MRLAHLSDLHFGSHDARLASELAEEVHGHRPDLVVISGDFTQVGSDSEFAAARTFLETLHAPFFAVPGNHDVPARNLLRRFITPYRRYRHYIADELEPFVEVEGVAIAGIKTSRRARAELNWSHGTISHRQLDALAARFDLASAGAVRVVVAHHPLLGPRDEQRSQMRRVTNAEIALRRFGALGVRLVLSGHFHLSYVRHYHHESEDLLRPDEPGLPMLVAQASSTISTRLRGHPNAYNIIDIDSGEIVVHVREWLNQDWVTRPSA